MANVSTQIKTAQNQGKSVNVSASLELGKVVYNTPSKPASGIPAPQQVTTTPVAQVKQAIQNTTPTVPKGTTGQVNASAPATVPVTAKPPAAPVQAANNTSVGLRSYFENQGTKVDWNPNTGNAIIGGVEIDSSGFKNNNGSYYVTPDQLQGIKNLINPPAPVDTTKPQLQGMSDEDWTKNQIQTRTNDINNSAQTQINTVNQNLVKLLSDLDAEAATINPAYQNTMNNINQNQFNTTESTREQMNSAGWDKNSGLAQGEVTRIGIAANKDRAAAETDKASKIADVARRKSLAAGLASTDVTNIQKDAANKIANVGGQVALEGDTRNLQRYQSLIGQYNADRTFNYTVTKDNKDRSYQISRDNVLDSHWLKTFNQAEAAQIIDKAYKEGMISISERETAMKEALLPSQIEQNKASASASYASANASNASAENSRASAAQTKTETELLKTTGSKTGTTKGFTSEDYYKTGQDMLNATGDALDKNGRPTGAKGPKYSAAQVTDWLMAVPENELSATEKVRIANRLGLPKPK